MAGSPEFLANATARLKNPVVLGAIGLAVAIVVGGAYAGSRFLSQRAAEAEQAAAVQVAPRPVAPAVPAPAPAPAVAAAAKPDVPGHSPAASSAETGKTDHTVAAEVASTEGTDTPVVTAVPQNAVSASPTQTHLDDHVTYQYNALGRRDPFQNLVGGPFVGADVGGDAPPDPGGIKVVGIVWGADDQFALVEDVRGNSFVLRKGDKVQNGVVEGLKRDGVIVNITTEGQSQTVVIPLVRKGDQNAR